MQYEVHGQTVFVSGEYGIYKAILGGFSKAYAVMDPRLLISTINGMSRDKAIKAVNDLRDEAMEQSQWEHTPQNMGAPLIRESPGPTPIEQVRDNIENTVGFCDDVLSILRGE